MSCNGCRVLRKGCSDACTLRPCLKWIESPEAQGHATLFVAKFFGRAGLVSFVSAVPDHDRPALFQSLLFEACGRTVNPVTGAVGLLRTGNWHVCQAAVETVLRGGTLRRLPPDEVPLQSQRRLLPAVNEDDEGGVAVSMPVEPSELELYLTTSPASAEPRPRTRPGSPSEESVTTSTDSGAPMATAAWQQQQQQRQYEQQKQQQQQQQQPPRLLNLFV